MKDSSKNIFVAIISLCFIALGSYSLYGNINLSKFGFRTQGLVENVQTSFGRPADRNDILTIKYISENGQEFHSHLDEGVTIGVYKIGNSIDLICDRREPNKCIPANGTNLWGSAIAVLIGCIALVLSFKKPLKSHA